MTALDVFCAAREAGSELALVTDGASVSYRELARGAARALGWLAARGVTAAAPRPVAVIAENSRPVFEMLHALIAIGAPIVLVHDKLERSARSAAIGGLLAVASDWSADPVAAPASAVPADERPLAIVQSSGSTGVPKRVVLSRRAFDAAQRASAELLGWRDGDRWLCCLPLSHVAGFAILIRCLAARKAVVLRTRWDDETTLASLVPTQLARWLAEPELPVPPRLRAVIVGGAAAAPETIACARARGIPALASYGMSETCGQVATVRPGDLDPGHVGAPLAGVEIRVVRGRIAVRGPMLASDLPLEDGFFVTDDLGRVDERGRLVVLGRASDRLVTGGENVDPLEVERVLERCPGVEQACVFGVPDAIWGERVVAAIVAGAAFDPSELGRFVARELASFKRPRAYATLDALCTLASGKLDRSGTARAAAHRLRAL